MKILVANIGSTSFKFRLLDMADERVLAVGAVEGVGQPAAGITLQFAGEEPSVAQRPVASQSDAVALCLAPQPHPVLQPRLPRLLPRRQALEDPT